ncbi:transglutaminase TgpA family protein [Novipirellula artificiosorum]|uniref:Protein-glutamine gamma-glutamyltransferase n=1 Tax=Novipirellula artificiosorum TaxID=2528016 RepID=A0A5C6DYC6_9BACT|nr:transglutaminaseTgpA domain-containing protein [Novipirellula artificiosorum]TWU40411.1 Protein-glutamine gamma-glutamyltransferase [Novipirellula artificiosorum]
MSLDTKIESLRLKLIERMPRSMVLDGAKDPIAMTAPVAEPLVGGQLRMIFALVSLLGGLVLASDAETHSFALIAIFFSLFGYLFVDWMGFFSLPPMLAYAAMIVSAIFCVSGLVHIDLSASPMIWLEQEQTGNRHLIAVSRLLVLVQAILMLQAKTRRVCEQLCIFCLLELIVAAVFNHAITFGILLIPIGLLLAFGLTLLARDATREQVGSLFCRSVERKDQGLTPSKGLYRSLMVMLVPAVILIAATFFYAIPRTTTASRSQGRGTALVGFSDEVRLQQFGQMLQSNDVAMHIWLTNQITGQPYTVAGKGLYLRGRVLEKYHSTLGVRPSSAWKALGGHAITRIMGLPSEFNPIRSSDHNFFDAVQVQIDCESIKSSALFAVAPYHQVERGLDVVHEIDRWTLRREEGDEFEFPEYSYKFGTHAFRGGIQTDMIARYTVGETEYILNAASPGEYQRDLLDFNPTLMPIVKSMADRIVSGIPERQRTRTEIAKRFEVFLSVTGGFEYTLNLNATPQRGVDPIEQFVGFDRRGHCQYFASALAMMLRSQRIPARLVVGYHTEDYNELGNYYVARQSHAHAWVEALIPHSELPGPIYGQPEMPEYWLRLDPTPGSNVESISAQRVENVFDYAKTLWKGYVVEVSANKANRDSASNSEMAAISTSRNRVASWLERTIARIRSGQLGGGTLAGGGGFSWSAACLGVLAAIGIFGLLRLPSLLVQRHKKKSSESVVESPRIVFYAKALKCLANAGIERERWQTPNEFARLAVGLVDRDTLDPSQRIESPLAVLTDAFYRLRFGAEGPSRGESTESQQIADALRQLDQRMDTWMSKQDSRRTHR